MKSVPTPNAEDVANSDDTIVETNYFIILKIIVILVLNNWD